MGCPVRSHPCGSLAEHEPHGWHRRYPLIRWTWLKLTWLAPRRCEGVFHVYCPSGEAHGLHRLHDPDLTFLGVGVCPGVGLAGICRHGVGVLDECHACEDERSTA